MTQNEVPISPNTTLAAPAARVISERAIASSVVFSMSLSQMLLAAPVPDNSHARGAPGPGSSHPEPMILAVPELAPSLAQRTQRRDADEQFKGARFQRHYSKLSNNVYGSSLINFRIDECKVLRTDSGLLPRQHGMREPGLVEHTILPAKPAFGSWLGGRGNDLCPKSSQARVADKAER